MVHADLLLADRLLGDHDSLPRAIEDAVFHLVLQQVLLGLLAAVAVADNGKQYRKEENASKADAHPNPQRHRISDG